MELQKSKSIDVALSFTQHLFSKEDYQGKNLIFSPLSLYAALSVIAAGAEGRTLDELLSFLRFDTVDHLNTYFSQGISPVFSDKDADADADAHHLSSTNGMFVDKSVSLSYPFRLLLAYQYKASLASLDFKNRGDRVLHDVNSLIELQSNGHITQLLPPGTITNLTRLIFANALRFPGLWKHKFDGPRYEFSFFLLNGTSVKVPFMTIKKKTHYIRAFDGFKILRLPYKQGRDRKRRFSMCIFLPDARDGLSTLIQKLSSEPGFLKGKLPRRKVRVDALEIPKFNISFTFEASNVLKEVGVVSPFSPMDACFTKMVEVNSPSNNLCVQSIFHKAFIEVNEKGTKATAASVGFAPVPQSARRPGPVINFIANHPFLFLIREDFTGTILFVGQVLNPLDGLPVERRHVVGISSVPAMLVKRLRWRGTPLSKDEDSMFLGLSRGCPPSPRVPSSVLFPEISHVDCRSDLRGCEGWKARSPSGLSCVDPFSVALRVPSDHEFVEGLADPPSKVSPALPRDKLLTPRARGRPKKVENRGRKRKTPTESSNGMTIADGIAVDSVSRGKEPKEFSEPYGVLTRARSALLMGKCCGMKYDCTYDTALY